MNGPAIVCSPVGRAENVPEHFIGAKTGSDAHLRSSTT
jgi:hypothetical protein